MAEAVAAANAAGAPRQGGNQVLDEDLLRAQLYSLLARLLVAAPDAALLLELRQAKGDASDLGQAFAALAREAAASNAGAVASEYHDLFIGIGRGELVPFGSYYVTGFLHEKPLAELRRALEGLGIERAPSVKEPEDHIAALCEVMAGLIDGSFGPPASLPVQREMFERHLAPWATRFFTDLETAQAASFYRPVGRIGRLFMGIERTAFGMVPGDEFDRRAT